MRYWNPQNFAVIGLAVCTACSDDKAPAPTTIEQTVTGRLYSVDGFPVSGATASAGVGALGSLTAAATAQTDDTGAFSLVVSGAVRDVVLVTFEADGYADHHVRRSLTGVGELDATSVISSAQPMVCRSGVCETDGVTILGLPEGTQGAARAFDPSANLDAFPGDFDEVNGAGLESGGFVWVGLRDAQGNPVTTLDSPATLDVVLQRPSWPTS